MLIYVALSYLVSWSSVFSYFNSGESIELSTFYSSDSAFVIVVLLSEIAVACPLFPSPSDSVEVDDDSSESVGASIAIEAAGGLPLISTNYALLC